MKFSGFNTTEKVGIGVGTSVPEKDLTVQSATSPAIGLYSTYADTNSRNWAINTNNSAYGDFTISTSAARLGNPTTIKMSILKDGKVGIGTTAPNANLHIGSAAAFGSQSNPALQIGGTTYYRLGFYTTAEGGVIENKNGDDGIIFKVKTLGEAMRIDSPNGSVGIGTTSPSVGLEVAKTSADASFKVNRTDQTNIQLIAAGSSYVRASAALILQSNGANNRLTLAADGSSTFSGNVLVNGTGTFSTAVAVGNAYIYTNYIRSSNLRVTDNGYLGSQSVPSVIQIQGDGDVAIGYPTTINSSLKATTILDASNSAGTNGQVLTSTGSALDWKTLSEISGVDGSGTANYIPKWTDSDTIGDSSIHEAGAGSLQIEGPSAGRFLTLNAPTTGGYITFETADTAFADIGTAKAISGNAAYSTTDLMINTRSGTKNIVFGMNGVEKVRIDNNGKVGIGSSNPAYKLDVRGDYIFVDDGKGIRIGGSSHQVTRETGNELRLKSASTTGFTTFYTGSDTEKMRIAADGKVGIGTTNPGGKLEVDGSSVTVPLLVKAGTGANSIKFVGRSTDNISSLDFFQNNGSSGGGFFQSNGTWMRVRADGGVHFRNGNTPVTTSSDFTINGMSLGIGTTAPAALLQVGASGTGGGGVKIYGATNGNPLVMYEDTNNAITHNFHLDVSDNAGLIMYAASAVPKVSIQTSGNSYFIGGNFGIGTAAPSSLLTLQSSDAAAADIFAIKADDGGNLYRVGKDDNDHGYVELFDGASTPIKVRLNSAGDSYFNGGKVGIGTTAPGAPLEVVGGSTNNNDTANVLALTGSEHIRAIIDTSSTAGHQASLVLESNSNEVSIATTGSNEMRFNAGGSESVRINSNGNVGIGETAPAHKLSIGDVAAIHLGYNSTSANHEVGRITSNTYNVDNSAYSLAEMDFMTSSANGYTGSIQFRTNSVNSTNTRAAVRMTILSNGNVGINVTDPDARLEIKGTGGSTGLTFKTTDSAGNASFWIKDGGRVGVHYYPFVVNQDSTDTACPASTLMYIHSAGPFTIKTDGKVGIGTTAPARLLHINGANDVARFQGSGSNYIDIDGNGTQLSCTTNLSFRASVSGNAMMTIKTDGKVGIGTTSPSAKLDVSSPAGTGVALAVKGGNNLVDNILLNLLNQSGTTVLNVRNNGALYGTAATFSGRIVGNDFEMLDSSGTGRTLVVRHSGNQVQFGDGSTFSIFRFNGTQVIPHADSTATLGTNALRWSTIYGDAGNFSEVMNLSGVNKIHQLSGHNFLQGDATMTYLYGGSGGGQIRTANNASSIIQWLDNGKVGINTLLPAGLIHLKQLAADHYGEVIEASGNDAWIRMGHNGTYGAIHTTYNSSAGATPLILGNQNNMTTQLVLATNNNVGIGTAAPGAKLDVVGGAVHISPDTAGKDTIRFTTNAANDGRILIKSDTTTKVDIQANGNTYFNGGSVGIGTTSPAALLHVYRGTYSNVHKSLILTNSSNTPFSGTTYDSVVINQDDVPCIRMRETGNSANVELTFAVGNEYSNSATIGTTGMFKFATNRTVGQTGYLDQNTRMVILADGKVGIGCTDPKNTFQVQVGTDHRIGFWGSSTYSAIQSANDANNAQKVLRFDASQYWFMGGNVGIGTVNAPNLLTLKGDSKYLAMYASDGSEAVRLGVDSSGDGQLRLMDGGGNTRIFFYGESGANSYINNGGKVGIGTTAPSSKLTVESNSTGESISDGLRIHNSHGETNDISPIYFGVHGGTRRAKCGIGWKRTGSYGIGKLLFALDNNGDDADVSFANDTKITFQGDGKVGIGTNAPDSLLMVYESGADSIIHVRGAAGGGDARVRINGYESSELYIDRNNVGRFAFRRTTGTDDLSLLKLNDNYTDNSTIMFWDYSSGSVGIGTTTPANNLHVKSSVSNGSTSLFIERNASTYGLLLTADHNGNSRLSAQGAVAAMLFEIGGSEKLRISNNGDVGIGTTSPNSATNKKTLEINATWGGVIENSVSGTVKSRWDWSTGGITQFGTYVNEPLHLITNSAMAVTILANGNVGIGTTAPVAQLNLFKTGADDAISSSLYFQRAAGNYGCAILQVGNGSAGTEKLMFTAGHNSNPVHITNAKMTIQQDGKVGIGTISPSSPLQVTIPASQGLTDFGGVTFQETANRRGLSMGWDNSSGYFWFYSRDVGVASRGINLNNALYVKSLGGNVGIGVTAPGAKLHVTGAPGNSTYLSYLFNSATHSEANGLNVQIASSGSSAMGLRVNTGGDSNAFIVAGDGDTGLGFTPSNFAQKLNVNGGAYINGFVGIGTATTMSSSAELLGVYSASTGHASFKNSSDSTGTVYIRNVSTTASTWQPYLILADSGGNRGGLALKYSTAGLKVHGQGGIEFWTGSSFGGGTLKMTIASNGFLTVAGDASIGSAATKLKTYSDSTYSGIYNGSSLASDEAIYFGAGTTYFKNNGATSLVITSASRVQLQATDFQLQYQSGSHIWFTRLQSNGTFAIHKNGVSDFLSIGSTGTVSVSSNFIIPQGNLLYLDGGSNTYIYSDTSDSIAIATGGSVRMTINSNGTVFMPNGKAFAFKSSSGVIQSVLSLNSSNAMVLGGTGMATNAYPIRNIAKYITFEPAGGLGVGIETMRITNASFAGVGSVGIGTTVPAALLHVYGGNLPFLSTSTTGSDMGQFTSNLTTYARLRIDCAASGDAQVSFMSAQVTKWSIGNDAGDSHKFKIATGFGAFSGAENLMIQQDGNIGIGTNAAGYKFHVQGDILASGSIMGNSKSFVIDHPTKPNSKLQYGALEGPEFGVYYRGRAQSNTITLPDYWTALVREETITVQLTPKGSFQHLYVVSQSLTEIVIGAADGETIDCFYTIYGERADIDRLEVEK